MGSPPGGRMSPPDRPARPSGWARGAGWLGTHPTRRAALNWAIWAGALVVVLAVASASRQGRGTAPAAAGRSTPRAASGRSTPQAGTRDSASGTAAQSSAARTRAAGAPATATAPAGSRPASAPVTRAAGGDVLRPGGVVLPDRARTPGATNPAVTPGTIRSTICVPGWTATVRPDSSYTTALKERQLATGYAYRGDTSTADYEEDHLISLELGGSPTAVANLWPEPYTAADGARVKDRIENKLHELVCAGQLGLRTAQHAIAVDWWQAYLTYDGRPVGGSAPSSTRAAAPTSPPVARTSAPAAPAGCHPRTDAGHCYEPGERCRTSDAGVTGVAGDGKAIRCEENDGLRWEPV